MGKSLHGSMQNVRKLHGEWLCDLCLQYTKEWIRETPVIGLEIVNGKFCNDLEGVELVNGRFRACTNPCFTC